MPTVTGSLSDFGLDKLPDAMKPQLTFTGSRLAITPGGQVLVPLPEPVTLEADGSWSVELASTEGMPKDAYYVLTAAWQAEGTGASCAATLRERVYIPIDGGAIGDLSSGSSSSQMYVHTGPTEPVDVLRPAYWLVTGPIAQIEAGVKLGGLYKLT